MAVETKRAFARAGLHALAIALPIALAVFLLFAGLSRASLTADPDRIAAQVRTAFATGQLDAEQSWLFGNTDLGIHQYNDCLILYQTLDDRGSLAQRTISPLTTLVDTRSACQHLQAFVAGEAYGPPRFYHQYLHAHTSLARLLVPGLGVRGTRELYRLLLSIVLLAGIGYAARDLVRGGRSAVSALWLVIFLVFARGFGLESFGQSLGHAPADLVLLGFLLFLSRVATLSRRAAFAAAAVFGALTMEFEFLTGGLPLGLAMVLGALPLTLVPDARIGGTVCGAAVAFVSAAAACVVAKLALVWAVFGPAPLRDIGGQLLFRTGISHAANHDQPAGWGDFFGHVWAGLDALAPGMQWLVVGLLVLAVVFGGWAYRQLRASAAPVDRLWAIALAGSNVVIPAWLVLFWQHTTEHAWFMDRLLVWPLATGAALFVLALWRRADTRI